MISDHNMLNDNQNILQNKIPQKSQLKIPKKSKNISHIQIKEKKIQNKSTYGLTKKENLENEKREKEGKIKINPVGCGRKLNWAEMEDCSEEVISKLKEIAIDDYYSGLLDISEKYNK